MFNILLDKLPTEYNGYRLRTDFRIGVQIIQAMQDNNLSDEEKTEIICDLLYIDIPQEPNVFIDGLMFFLQGWNHDKTDNNGTKVMDFDIDHGRLYTAFYRQYGIDLNTADIHFWQFMILMTNLEECSFTRVIDIRAKRITSKMTKEEISMYIRLKDAFNLEQQDTQAVDEVTKKFLRQIGGEHGTI